MQVRDFKGVTYFIQESFKHIFNHKTSLLEFGQNLAVGHPLQSVQTKFCIEGDGLRPNFVQSPGLYIAALSSLFPRPPSSFSCSSFPPPPPPPLPLPSSSSSSFSVSSSSSSSRSSKASIIAM